jgi:uncharacterized membrane protein
MGMQPGVGGGAAFGAAFVLVWLVFIGAWVAGCIIFLVATWRMMRAHESLAESARIATEIMETKRSTGA